MAGTPEAEKQDSQAQRIDAPEPSYLGVRYGENERPYTSYPYRLTQHLCQHYLEGYEGARLVDLGSGRGEFLNGFARLGFDALGIDREFSSQRPFPEPVLRANLETGKLPLGSASVGVLFSKSVFEHIRDISHLLMECHRVLKPGGRMLVMVPDFVAQRDYFYDDWTHVRPFTLTGLGECLRSHGFVVRENKRFRQLPFLWKRPYLRPLASVAARLPDALISKSKLVRFSKGWMLLAVADKPLIGAER